MERDNFYLLLELSLEPPETNDEVIWEAIQKKKAEWSRLRNHPTKGIQAQKYISMIPEIQRIMMYSDFRQREALDAIQIIKKGKTDKYVEIDRHIDILLGKGFVEKEEIVKLSEIHNIDENEIKDRINLKLEEKLIQVDQEISIRMAKGYLSEADIEKIAGRHALTQDQIRQRVRCPIVKNGADKIQPPKPLDKSIEKSIIENLKIIKKTSLYDFLSTPAISELKTLQEKSTIKKRELSNLSRKDADVTAGTILTGHCLTIFKNDESRYAYDVSLAKARLGSLYSDIDMSAIEGKIRAEYFDILILKGMDLGMDREEAAQFIDDYCKTQNYQIEKKEESAQVEKKKMPRAYIIGCAIAALMILASIFYFMHKKGSAESEYEALIESIEKQTAPEEKTKLLKQYLNTHKQKNKLTQDASARIKEIESHVMAKEFESIMLRAEKAVSDGNIDMALSIYREYLKSNPPDAQKAQVNDHLRRLSEQIERKDFDEVSTVALKGEPDQKIEVFQRYLAQHPDGPHKAEVEKLLQEMSGEYYIYIKKMLSSCEQNMDWKGCVDLCETFIRLYDNSNADQLKQLLPAYQENARNETIFKNLVEKASQRGSDHNAAKQVYKDFLAAYPNSPLKVKIQAEITRLEEIAAIAAIDDKKAKMRSLIAGSGGRFSEQKDGVVVDSKTGLMWTLVDAMTAEPNTCINYEYAKKYVDELKTAGYTDWRLPTPAELSGIYKMNPSFPSASDTECFWTSESFTSYSDGWHIKTSSLCKEKAGQWEPLQKDSKECGNVRAVRGR
ncbi:MAG: DUF1566 domain-containing protein [Desulfobacterales bacterium]|jgi:tetratricopeptide (TPR) repeat protein|nr:DUF1566 domain-containing protein [Desulfobacterales bacterium]